MPITQQRLKELLHYDPNTGIFTWLVDKGPRKAGERAGGICFNKADNYAPWRITIDKTLYGAHRLAWLYVYGEMPTMLDHINRNPSDNRICNLRIATLAQNMQNTKRAKGKAGLRGVVKMEGRFAAFISHNNRRLYLGLFDTAEAAHKVWCEAAVKLRGEFARFD